MAKRFRKDRRFPNEQKQIREGLEELYEATNQPSDQHDDTDDTDHADSQEVMAEAAA
ncbi:MAG: hypothetical protein J5J00_13465 [Deltaproteobacteria bacterium]|nr:hypothetical protein [Deltaproteobacteria bacterium]